MKHDAFRFWVAHREGNDARLRLEAAPIFRVDAKLVLTSPKCVGDHGAIESLPTGLTRIRQKGSKYLRELATRRQVTTRRPPIRPTNSPATRRLQAQHAFLVRTIEKTTKMAIINATKLFDHAPDRLVVTSARLIVRLSPATDVSAKGEISNPSCPPALLGRRCRSVTLNCLPFDAAAAAQQLPEGCRRLNAWMQQYSITPLRDTFWPIKSYSPPRLLASITLKLSRALRTAAALRSTQ